MTNRELDALIDQKIFNVQRFIGNNQIFLGSTEKDLCPFYTTNISASWKILEKLNEIGYLATIEQIFHDGFPNNRGYQCTLLAHHLSRIMENMNRGLIVGIAPDAPQAICSAIAKAIEINVAMAELQAQEKANNVP